MDHSHVPQQSPSRRISPAAALEVSDLEEDSFTTQKRDDLRRACLVNLISFAFGSISDWGREQRQFNDFLDDTCKSLFEPPELYLRPYETRHFATVDRLCRSREYTATDRLMHVFFILADTVPLLPGLGADRDAACRANLRVDLDHVLNPWEVEPVEDDEQDQEALAKLGRHLHLPTLREWVRRFHSAPEATGKADDCPPAAVEGGV